MKPFSLFTVASAFALVPASAAPAQSSPRWVIEPTPLVTIGASEADTNDLLAVVVGATRLPDGRILVGDRGSFSLRLFSAAGAPVRSFGRKGAGPGEITYLKSLLRCGDTLVTIDIEARRTSLFTLGGAYVRSFRFGSPQPGSAPYDTVCNGSGVFAHFGWEGLPDMKGGAYRADVPFWITGADSAVRRVIGTFPGAERYGIVVQSQVRGSRPLGLGKRTALAVGPDRVYIGTADQYEIMVFDLSGKQVAAIRRPRGRVETTRADIEYATEQEISTIGERARRQVEQSYAEMPIPKTLPAYAAFRVDAAGHLWVQDYPRARSPVAKWSVFDSQGRPVAEVELPVHLEPYEIGQDYVLGRFLDPDESIPQVRLYRLRRGAAR